MQSPSATVVLMIFYMADKTVSLVIPCYNEQATIEELLRRVEEADFGSWRKEIVVVDDGSRDRTREILSRYKDRPQYKVIFQPKNSGKGVAERAGIAAAGGDYVVLQDADLEYDPQEIRAMREVVDATGAPIVFGSRNLKTHWHRARNFFVISLGVWLSTQWVNLLYGTRLTDAWTCYKLFSREVAQKARFIGNGFEADYLFIGDASVKGYPIVEVAISHAPRTVEEGKKIRYGDGFYSMWHLLLHRLAHLRSPAKQDSHADARRRIVESLIGLQKESSVSEEAEVHLHGVNWLKSFLKQFPALYYFVWGVFCPALMVQNGPKRIYHYTKGLVADIGSGPDRIAPEIINVDMFPFPGVDVVASANALPFADGTFDGAVNESLLEHVPNPRAVAAEIMRVVKPGGYIYTSAPFIHPFHASPDDFNRFTRSGLKELFPECEVIEQGIRSGPWSALLLFVAYWLGAIVTLGSRRFAPFAAHVCMLILGPFKIFDLLFTWMPDADAVSAHLFIIVRKKNRP